MAKKENHLKGEYFEALAASCLLDLGMTILERNYRFHRNEVDIVALDSEAIVFVEVKARLSRSFGMGYEAVDRKKILSIRKAAEGYLIEHAYNIYGTSIRFDVISIDEGRITYIKNAF